MKVRTMRGTAIEGQVTPIIVDDGNFNHAYKVIDFVVTSRYPAGNNNAAFGTLHLDADADPVWNWDDNRQIAWAASAVVAEQGSVVSAVAPFKVIDPDHLVIRDLYITCQLGGSVAEGELVNYMITLEPVTISDDVAVLTLIKERSQDDR